MKILRTLSRRCASHLLCLVLFLAAITIVLSACAGAATTPQTPATQPDTAVTIVPPPAITTTMRPAQAHIYVFSRNDAGLMQPAMDVQGNLWVGEMYANRLGRYDSHTGAVTHWQAPNAKFGIMTTTIDVQGNVWFVEQDANYIGRFDPRTEAFRIYPLGTLNGREMGPQDVAFDSHGMLWFTAAAGGGIGRLDPRSGALHIWPVPSLTGQPASPYSLALTPDGQVWFGELSGGAIGHLDPATGHITLYRLHTAQAAVFSMALDSQGRVWFTEIAPSKLGMFDPARNMLTEMPVPKVSSNSPALYGLVVTRDDTIWFVNNGAGALVRYVPSAREYTFYQLDLPAGAPYGLALDQAGRLWFTADGSSANYVGVVSP